MQFSTQIQGGLPAFVFDIDGVLIRGRDVLPVAVQAMQQLCPAGRWRFPVCFMTNGGGVSEARKAEQLAGWLGVPVDSSQVILSHTPMRSLVPQFRDKPVLVAGRGHTAEVAYGYGFSKVLTTAQLAAALPTALPFASGSNAPPPHAPGHRGPAAPCPVRDLGWATASAPLAAVLVMTDPHDFYVDLQLLLDVITGHGDPMAQTPPPGSPPVPLFFSNPDVWWASEHRRPRLGQGAFAAALEALHRQVAGGPLPCAAWFGKPNPEPYRLAEQLLLAQAQQMGLIPAHHPASTPAPQRPAPAPSSSSSSGAHLQAPPTAAEVFSGIYAVGDNPAADVRGANQAGLPWVSVLVRTGVFEGPPGANSPSDPAQLVVDHVLQAVQAVLHRTRSQRWHSMR